MKIFSEELIEEIKLNNGILDVVSEYVRMTRKGKDYFGLCPFHQEKTPSFSVVPGKGIYYCFGCHSGGSVIQFIMNIENLKYYEALEFLAKKANISIPEEIDDRFAEIEKKRKRIIEINKKAAHFYFENLFKNKPAQDYLAGRKIRSEAAVRFGLGYSDSSGDSLTEHLKNEGFETGEIFEAGLITRNRYGGYTEKFRNRIIFPILDVYGNVLAFGGRVIDRSGPKYLNSPETIAYKKGRHLYGMNFAKKTGREHFIVVEGYIDVVVMYQEGYDCFVASLGTALTIDQARLLNRYDKKIILAYDNDEAGKAASLRAIDILRGIGTEPSIINMTGSKDPDEYIRKSGSREFQALIENALSPVEFKVEILKKNFSADDTHQKVDLFKGLIKILSELDDMTAVDIYASKYSRELKISKDAILNDVSRKKGNTAEDVRPQDTKGQDARSIGMQEKYEMMILLLYFNHKKGRERIERYFASAKDTASDVMRIHELIFDTKKDLTFADILDRIKDTPVSSLMKMNDMIENIQDAEKALDDFILKLHDIEIENKREQIKNRGKNGRLGTEDIEELRDYSEKVKKMKKVREES